MFLRLIREPSKDQATLGSLYIDGVWHCWTLEDVLREVKVSNFTAIPAGRYPVIIDESRRFKRLMPHVLNVPGFEGIRIHAGNTPADTEGCILLGRTRAPGFVGESRLAFDTFFMALLQDPESHLLIEDPWEVPPPEASSSLSA